MVRNAHTGSTHHLDPLSSEVLRALIEAPSPLTAQEIAIRLAQAEGADNDGEWEKAIQEVLSHFRRSGLAEPETA